ncbi:MAG: hypothetical protein FWD17_14325 [Polyangiaceae bacterium]|nr:hypothetical protein [Polyangiaceae bacterium]
MDGQWILRHGRWYWLLGRWVKTPPGWTYSPWVFVRREDGAGFYAPSLWKDGRGVATGAPPALAYATASGEGVVDAEGNPVQTGRNLETPPAVPVESSGASQAPSPPATSPDAH